MAEEAKKKRTTTKGQFTRTETALRKALDMAEECPQWTLDRRYEELKRRWDSVQEAHDSYIQLLTDDEEIQSEDSWIEEIAARFDKLEVQVGKRKQPPNNKAKDESSTKEGHSQCKRTLVKLPPIQFQTFSGDMRKYPLFKEEFLTHVLPLCEKGQEALVLKSYLSEEIREEVLNAGGNPSDIWARLDNKYGRPDKIVDTILSDLKALSRSGVSDQLQMITIVEKAYRDLERINEEGEMQNSTIISIIEESMSEQMQYEWVKLVASEHLNSRAKSARLIKFLRVWRDRLEYKNANIRDGSECSGQIHHAKSKQTQQRNQSLCWLHNREGKVPNHPIWVCQLFRHKSIPERIDLVESNHACKRCLEIGCSGAADIKKCPRSFVCNVPECGSEHNTLLHPAGNKVNHPSLHSSGSSTDAALPIQAVEGNI